MGHLSEPQSMYKNRFINSIFEHKSQSTSTRLRHVKDIPQERPCEWYDILIFGPKQIEPTPPYGSHR